MSYRKKSYNSH